MPLITPEYAALNRELHERIPAYGTGGYKWARWVRAICRKNQCLTVLDYGSGKGSLKADVPELDVREYDPGIPGKDSRPEPADLVVCTDVLEHVEPECIDDVLSDIVGLSNRAVLLAIACRGSQKLLADGRSAHILVRSPDWWQEKLSGYGPFKRIEGGELEYNAVMRHGI